MSQNVYFAAALNRIKIGVSIDVAARLVEVGAHLPEPLDLIGVVRGDELFERAIHRHLKAYRLKGEWFKDCSEVRETIAGILRDGPQFIGFVRSNRDSPTEAKPYVDPWEKRGAALSRLMTQCEHAAPLLVERDRRAMLHALRAAVDAFEALIENALRDLDADDAPLLSKADRVVTAAKAKIVRISLGIVS